MLAPQRSNIHLPREHGPFYPHIQTGLSRPLPHKLYRHTQTDPLSAPAHKIQTLPPQALRIPCSGAAAQIQVGQTVEREKVYRAVEVRNLASLANNTRWDTAFRKLSEHRVRARLKHVAWPDMSNWSAWIIPAENYLEVVSAGPVHFREIEWVDFDCADSDLKLQQCLASVGESKLTAEVIDQFVRVFGYR